MTPSVPPSRPAGHADLVERYEQLRRQALSPAGGGMGGQGLMLFLRHGMKGWMNGWSRCCTVGPAKPSVDSGPVEAVVPWHLRREVVAILTGMALNIGQEIRA
jgi:hypothetical protein